LPPKDVLVHFGLAEWRLNTIYVNYLPN